jgi:hypothetical protein
MTATYRVIPEPGSRIASLPLSTAGPPPSTAGRMQHQHQLPVTVVNYNRNHAGGSDAKMSNMD